MTEICYPRCHVTNRMKKSHVTAISCSRATPYRTLPDVRILSEIQNPWLFPDLSFLSLKLSSPPISVDYHCWITKLVSYWINLGFSIWIIASRASSIIPSLVNFLNIGGSFVCRFYLRFWITCVCLVAEKV